MDQIKPEFVKKLTKLIVVSIWVLSLLLTHYFYIYRFTIQLVTHAVSKNYMFIICNGLLVFVAKCSGLVASSKQKEEYMSITTDKTFDYRDFESYNAILELEYDSSDHGSGESEFVLAQEVTVEDQDIKQQETEEKEEEEDDEECLNEEDEEENIEMMTSTEEDMNKKFDEFIRKMKEELRIEAKQQLILV